MKVPQWGDDAVVAPRRKTDLRKLRNDALLLTKPVGQDGSRDALRERTIQFGFAESSKLMFKDPARLIGSIHYLFAVVTAVVEDQSYMEVKQSVEELFSLRETDVRKTMYGRIRQWLNNVVGSESTSTQAQPLTKLESFIKVLQSDCPPQSHLAKAYLWPSAAPHLAQLLMHCHEEYSSIAS